MKVYIFSMICNEQRYIDEWLEYNFNIGVDKIVLYEDYTSDPHDISKYEDKVELLRIPDCFDEKEMRLLKNHIYRQRVVYQHFNRIYRDDCDWFFLTDVDEYLEVDNIKQFISKYDKYDQICLKYKMYGWDEHIYDPYPGEKYSTRNTYRQVVRVNTEIKSLSLPIKSILKSKSSVPYKQCPCSHIPHMFISRNTRIVFNLLGHYWTRSLEEYIWRLNVCGLIKKADWNRTIDNFFEINNLDKKDYEVYLNEFMEKYGSETKINDDF